MTGPDGRLQFLEGSNGREQGKVWMPAWQLRALTGVAFLVAAMLLFARLGDLPLIDPDEGRNAEVSREMAETGAWVVPSFNGIPYLDKPALYFRAVALSFTIFGRNEFTARLPSALSAALLAVLMWAFCRRVYGERAGALTVLVLATTPLVVGFARLVIFDMPLALFTTMAIVAGYRAEEQDGAVTRRRWLLVGAASSAVATLIKGPVGLLVPGAVLTVFSLVERRPRAILRMLDPRNLALFLAIVLPWFLALVHAHPEFLRYGLVEESARRFLMPSFRRTEPVYYFGPVLLLAMYPWSALLPESAVVAWRHRARWMQADRFLIVWAVVVVAFFSSSQSKRPGYILPAVVALAALTARLLDQALSESNGLAARLVLRGTLGMAILSTAAAAALSLNLVRPNGLQILLNFESNEFGRLEPDLGVLVVSLLVVAVAAFGVRLWRDVRLALAVFALPALLFLSVGFGTAARYAEASSARALARAIPPLPPGSIVACLECFVAGLPFYVGEPVIYITERGRGGLTSNYVRYRLKRGAAWPATLVRLNDREQWLARQTVPVYVLTKEHARPLLDDIARRRDIPVLEVHPGWWGTLVPWPR
jgi:4-amino-4-deoxy-L-arabinose transferase-like glycosyltransferase